MVEWNEKQKKEEIKLIKQKQWNEIKQKGTKINENENKKQIKIIENEEIENLDYMFSISVYITHLL